MKIIHLNSVYGYGSTGSIVKSIHEKLQEMGHESYVIYGRKKSVENKNIYYISNIVSLFFHLILTRLFSLHGFGSTRPTQKIIKLIQKIKPDIIHIHNLHGYYLNIPMLKRYLVRSNINILMTVHDDWLIYEKAKYKKIPTFKLFNLNYPKSFMLNFPKVSDRIKTSFLNELKNIQLVFPSRYMMGIFKKHYINLNKEIVVHNGIETSLFREAADLRKELELIGFDIYLSVSNVWNESKGINILIELSKLLNSNEKLIIVGKSKRNLPSNVIHLSYVKEKSYLAKLYKTANIFINPTLKDNFPTVNLEALASGLPIIAFDIGGNSEVINDEVGRVLTNHDALSIYRVINEIKTSKAQRNYSKKIDRIKQFDQELMYERYSTIYERSISE